jgi:hypothetical protein
VQPINKDHGGTIQVDIQALQRHVLTLATLEETDAPVVSCYLNLETGMSHVTRVLDERVRLLRKTISGPQRQSFEEALHRIACRVSEGFRLGSVAAAIFSRSGEAEFFLDLEFRVPLPTWIGVGSTPNIYHLVELKDTYDRYVVVLVNEHTTRILEVHLGAVTEGVWAKRPELRERVGRGWSREQFQSHRRERNHRYTNDIARFLDGLMTNGGYSHLILAGTPKITALLRQSLPKRLTSKLIDIVPASTNDRTSDVVAATLATFIDKEQQESLAAVERLRKEIWAHGLAAIGPAASLQALKSRQADLLVMAAEYVSDPAWICAGCHTTQMQESRPSNCPDCGSLNIRELDVKEELVRQAELTQSGVEIVHESEMLMSLGGVGCLLRFSSPEAYVHNVGHRYLAKASR